MQARVVEPYGMPLSIIRPWRRATAVGTNETARLSISWRMADGRWGHERSSPYNHTSTDWPVFLTRRNTMMWIYVIATASIASHPVSQYSVGGDETC